MRKQQAKKIPLAPDPKFGDTISNPFCELHDVGRQKKHRFDYLL
jgi:hypothetical protein